MASGDSKHVLNKSCLSKQQYDNKKQAEDMCKYILTFNNIVVKSYKCAFCDKWHITKKNRRRK